MEHVITEKRTLVHKGSIIDVYSDEMLLPNGNHETWDYVEHRMGAACVLPVLPNGKIVMVKQFRHARPYKTLLSYICIYYWCTVRESNPEPANYEFAALPTELTVRIQPAHELTLNELRNFEMFGGSISPLSSDSKQNGSSKNVLHQVQ